MIPLFDLIVLLPPLFLTISGTQHLANLFPLFSHLSLPSFLPSFLCHFLYPAGSHRTCPKWQAWAMMTDTH